MINKYDYFGKNEILENDQKFIHKESLESLFKKFIRELYSISLTVEESKDNETKESKILKSNEYLEKLKILYNNYLFPSD